MFPPLPPGEGGRGVVPSPAVQPKQGWEGANSTLPAARGRVSSRVDALDPDSFSSRLRRTPPEVLVGSTQ